jgi:hypothetical protein
MAELSRPLPANQESSPESLALPGSKFGSSGQRGCHAFRPATLDRADVDIASGAGAVVIAASLAMVNGDAFLVDIKEVVRSESERHRKFARQ